MGNPGGWRGPGWQVFDSDPRHGRQIRDWISSAFSGHSCPVDAADAALAVTELFSNAVRHGPAGGRVLVGYCLWHDGARLIVCDAGGPGAPRLVHGGELTEGGRGMHLVDSLAARWGTFRLAGALAVWCDLGQPMAAPADDAWAWLHLVLSACDLTAPGHPARAGNESCGGQRPVPAPAPPLPSQSPAPATCPARRQPMLGLRPDSTPAATQ